MSVTSTQQETPALRFESYSELDRRGIPYSRVHLARLVRAGLFPAPVPLSSGGRVAWLSSELDQWMLDRAAARDEVAA